MRQSTPEERELLKELLNEEHRQRRYEQDLNERIKNLELMLSELVSEVGKQYATTAGISFLPDKIAHFQRVCDMIARANSLLKSHVSTIKTECGA